MEKHKCKLCPRSFSNGRALGGHMKAHLAALPLPPKIPLYHQQQQQQVVDCTDSTSSSSSGEEREVEDGKIGQEGEEKSLGYGLRNNPKKSFRLADPEFSFAVDSVSVVVQDRESETESKNPTRRRSKRTRKIFTASSLSQEDQNTKVKKLSCSESPTEPEPVSSVSDTSPEEDVAMCLMMLSRDVWMRSNEEEGDENGKKRERSVKHRCEKCKKVFRSYHALGGHKKVCEVAETRNGGKVSIFECPFCFKVFGSGQALGGHKRSHLLPSSTTAAAAATATVTHSAKFDNTLIDLNLPAPLEEDDYSVVSDA
ncbi:zinc finger protein ZAT1 [Mangifera indica]|uniref:zinc finger protein ZAT1 n=1 Tax=Mangifera indica TaxID=29780 RepID=UPI001CF947EE|nr:zinc finger protein ZAT1 [Mangifera indica]